MPRKPVPVPRVLPFPQPLPVHAPAPRIPVAPVVLPSTLKEAA